MQDTKGLRGKQAQLTRDLVLGALAAVIVEEGLTDFSVQDVAERAGVSHRTVYRHFETREAMLDALVHWVEERVSAGSGMALPEDANQVVPAMRAKFAALDEWGPIVMAVLKLETARRIHSQQSLRSALAIRGALAETTAHLPSDVAEVVAAVIRQIASSQTWLALHEDAGIDGARSADVVAWAVETLLDELRAGRGPGANRS